MTLRRTNRGPDRNDRTTMYELSNGEELRFAILN
jgi:hypothetical protein